MLGSRVRFYSWSGHGNVGDDWIADVASRYFTDPVLVREQRSLSPRDLGRHVLRASNGTRVTGGNLLLWGGGWLAADRPASRTISAWARYLEKTEVQFAGMGLGIGPFNGADPKQERQLAQIFKSLRGRVAVRTPADLDFMPADHDPLLGCDVALLDDRWDLKAESRRGGDYNIVSFPSYSAHWAHSRPWLTEDWYRNHVEELARRDQSRRTTIFVEFDEVRGGRGDADYWSYLGCKIVRPSSIRNAADIFRNAHHVYAGRLHASILGALVGVPTLALAYHHKFGVVDELGVRTFGLASEPTRLGKPVSADPGAIRDVRDRGRHALSMLMAND